MKTRKPYQPKKPHLLLHEGKTVCGRDVKPTLLTTRKLKEVTCGLCLNTLHRQAEVPKGDKGKGGYIYGREILDRIPDMPKLRV